jgi:hypothetical protein
MEKGLELSHLSEITTKMSFPAEKAAIAILERLKAGEPTVDEIATIIDDSGLFLAMQTLNAIKESPNKYKLEEYNGGYLWEKVDEVTNRLRYPYKGVFKPQCN